MRRSELTALEVEDLTWVDDEVRVLIRRSKTDQTGEGQEIAVPRGLKLCPVASLQTWLQAASITEGKVFRAVLQGGRVQQSITPECLSRVIKKLARRIDLDPKDFAGHSLRAGFTTSCVEVGAPLLKIMETTRHKSVAMLQVYSRRVDLFRDHAASSWL
jgi:integrase